MPARRFCFRTLAAVSLGALLAAPAAQAKPDDFAGTWILASGKLGAKCRVLLRADRSDNGSYFLGMPAACRHSMPQTETIGRWSANDDTHLTLVDPAGTPVLSFTGSGSAFMALSDDDSYTLQKIQGAPPRPAEASEAAPPAEAPPAQTVATSQAAPAATIAPPPAKKGRPVALDADAIANMPGRYAVMRDKRDTGCMLTLDKTRSKGADRAQLAPGCRDQGIVVFDPSSWQIIKGELVLTARAGHKTKFLGSGEGTWQKDPKMGGKPLGLKKL